ncbi:MULTISPECIES: hypothetical protein [unclassified Luteococcus]|uniref:hypothetical protein n=1 Tax=unclassified Luteococcus TaxID=2639923 RepID=UPI00313C9E22
MPDKKKAATFASVAVAGLIVAGGATAALNANAETTTPTNGSGYGAPAGHGQGGGGEQGGRGGHGMRGTEVTGDELTKVTNAIKAKDSAFAVDHVMKDTDGNYHVMGTKSGNRTGYEVSKDLKTITAHTVGERDGKGGHQHTAATADETAEVTAAVKAKDAAVTVESVQKDPDGSYDVRGTKAGSEVMVEVSKDLKTIEVRTDGPR